MGCGKRNRKRWDERKTEGSRADRKGESSSRRHVKLADFLFFFFALNKNVDRTSDKPKMLCSLDQDFERWCFEKIKGNEANEKVRAKINWNLNHFVVDSSFRGEITMWSVNKSYSTELFGKIHNSDHLPTRPWHLWSHSRTFYIARRSLWLQISFKFLPKHLLPTCWNLSNWFLTCFVSKERHSSSAVLIMLLSFSVYRCRVFPYGIFFKY